MQSLREIARRKIPRRIPGKESHRSPRSVAGFLLAGYLVYAYVFGVLIFAEPDRPIATDISVLTQAESYFATLWQHEAAMTPVSPARIHDAFAGDRPRISDQESHRSPRSVAGFLLAGYLVYAYVFGILIFAEPDRPIATNVSVNEASRFHADMTGPDRVLLLEDAKTALIARVDLLQSARESLSIAMHLVRNDKTSLLFYALLFEAADRGVRIQLLLDGYVNPFLGRSADLREALLDHPNIEFRQYEPLCLLRPWTGNNRLHTKLIVADGQRMIIGGRNIADRYFSMEENKRHSVKDRDVLILRTGVNQQDSVLTQAESYFATLWQHEAAMTPVPPARIHNVFAGDRPRARLNALLAQIKTEEPALFDAPAERLNATHPTRQIMLIHNPVQRLRKEPWILAHLSDLLKSAKTSIVLQSPYIIATEAMTPYLDFAALPATDIKLLTNSSQISPNWFAQSAYVRQRARLAATGRLYEYPGPQPLHAKTYLIDERVTVIGSFNLDSRSAFLSAEAAVVIDSESLAKQVRQSLDQLLAQSVPVPAEPDDRQTELPVFKRLVIAFLEKFLFPFEFML